MVANDAVLAKQSEPSILKTMKKGRAPVARESGQVGRRIKLELHHKNYISKGGGVYDVENINIVTPKSHLEIHKGAEE